MSVLKAFILLTAKRLDTKRRGKLQNKKSTSTWSRYVKTWFQVQILGLVQSTKAYFEMLVIPPLSIYSNRSMCMIMQNINGRRYVIEG